MTNTKSDKEIDDMLNSKLESLVETMVKTLSTRIKLNSDTLDVQHDIENRMLDTVSSLEKQEIVLECDIKNIKTEMSEHKEKSKNRFDDIYKKINTISDDCKNLQGSINQIKMKLEEGDRLLNERKSRFLGNYLYPMLLGLSMMLIGYIFNSCITFNIPDTKEFSKPANVHSRSRNDNEENDVKHREWKAHANENVENK
jgi:hypothetical protein